MGGSFNPPHQGHLFIAGEAIKRLGLKRLLFLVSPKNPLKNKAALLFERRLELCKEITKNHRKIMVSDLEKKFFPNAKNYYTIDFLKRLKLKYPHYDIKFIIGADNLINFHKWKNHKEISQYCEIIVFNRVDGRVNYKYKALKSKFGVSGKYKVINAKHIDISSTRIRKSS